MNVFRGYLLIIRRNLITILMYIGIFVGIAVGIGQSYLSTGAADGFASLKLKTAVIDREGGLLGETLRKMMEREQILVELEDDPQVIQEELFYRNVEYVLVVPQGAAGALEQGERAVQYISVPGSVSNYYVEAQVNVFLNQIRIYRNSGFSLEEACEKALTLGEIPSEVTLLDVNGNGGSRVFYNYFFAYMPYAFLGSAIMAVSLVIMEFKKRDVRRRIESCAVPFWKQALAMAGAFLTIGILVWGICILIQAVLYQGGIFTSKNAGIYLANSLACILVALSLGFISGLLANNEGSLNGINNVFSLGLCFLGGIFVPLEMLGEGVRKVAQFLPTYWYSVINGILGDYEQLGGEMMGQVWKGLLIQFLFAAVCFSAALVLRRWKNQER